MNIEHPGLPKTNVNPAELPDHVERVDEAFDNTSLPQAHAEGLVDNQVPHHAQDVIEMASPDTANFLERPVATKTNEKKGRAKLIAAIGGFATVTVAAAALFLAPKGESNHTENIPTPTQPVASGEATPGATQGNNSNNTDLLTPPANVVETRLFKDLTPEQQATIKQLENMSVDDFRKLPLETQLMFGQFVYDNNVARVKYAMEQLGFDDKDYADRVVAPAVENTGQQAYDSSKFILDTTTNLYTTNNIFDTKTARKVLPLSVSTSTANYKHIDETLLNQPTGLTFSTGKVTAYKVSTEQDVTRMTVNVTRKNDIDTQDTMQLAKFKDIQGKNRVTWQQTRSIPTSDPRFDSTVK